MSRIGRIVVFKTKLIFNIATFFEVFGKFYSNLPNLNHECRIGKITYPLSRFHTPFRLYAKNADGMLIYGPIPESRYDDVIRHLRHSFPDEPLNVSVGLCQHGQPCEVLENHNLETMKDGLSLMVTDKETGVIAGVVLNGISWKGDPEKYLEELKSVPNLQYQRIFGLLNSVNKEADLFTKYNVDKVFDVRILSVDEKFRGKGIAKELFKRSEVVAQQNGFKIMKTDATSLFTQRVAESCGYFTEKSVKYHDYKDEKGKKIYDTISPHDFYKIMVKIVPTNPTG